LYNFKLKKSVHIKNWHKITTDSYASPFEIMGQSSSSSGLEERGRKSIALAINESSRSGSFSDKRMRQIFACYDTGKSGHLEWREAKRYLSDLLELSGNQAVVIREAREKVGFFLFDGVKHNDCVCPCKKDDVLTIVQGVQNVAEYYERFLRECFDYLDVNKSGTISIDELVRPSNAHLDDMLSAVRHLSEMSSKSKKTPLVLSSKMRSEPPIETTGALCVGGCGFVGDPNTEGYCASCLSLILHASEPNVPTRTVPSDATKQVKRVRKKVPSKTNPVPPPPPLKQQGTSKQDDKGKSEIPNNDVMEVEEGGMQTGVGAQCKLTVCLDSNSSNDERSSDKSEEDDFLETSNRERHDKFTVIDGTQVEKLMGRKIGDAADLLGLSVDEASLVLMYFEWDLQRLRERYFADVDKYRHEAGIALPDGVEPCETVDGDCSICYDETSASDATWLKCGHGPFCKGCYVSYLHERVGTGGASTIFATTCMGKGCNIRLSPMQWKRIAAAEDYHRYRYFYYKNYVESSNNLGFW
jgi:hypothetical protein